MTASSGLVAIGYNAQNQNVFVGDLVLVAQRSSAESRSGNRRDGDKMVETAEGLRARLPAAVYDLAIRLGVKSDSSSRSVKLSQIGRMKRSLDNPSWMAFTAFQTISTCACEFDWLAKLGPFGVISARDALKSGEGRLDVMALGVIPIARTEHTPALVRGELMRYLAELAWAPDAILGNASLRWRSERPATLAVSAGAGPTAAEVTFSLDSDGRIQGAYAPDRPRSATAPVLLTPWQGRFSDYRYCGKRWIPFAGEVAWEIEGKSLTYWQGRIERWDAC